MVDSIVSPISVVISERKTRICGVPQGLILSPFVFAARDIWAGSTAAFAGGDNLDSMSLRHLITGLGEKQLNMEHMRCLKYA
ncbi:hypothetical protein J6590_018909 [Homalodisca vitripennis]|nr:hypothetical protein J6590_018909 [Homalodisca vitripennis]